jgi:hypothetical protein
MADAPVASYRPPSWFDRRIVNPLVATLSGLGLSVAGSRVLEVRGRKSGELRRNPVNPLVLEGDLRLGRQREHVRATELEDAAKEPVLRAYLRRWKWEVGQFFDGVSADSSADELARIAPNHPIFLIEPAEAGTRDPVRSPSLPGRPPRGPRSRRR